ncbi:hypothetical protein K3495_g471 [Podosphaera aphanis]|nr:hypothetical protein K3495_g471 [Podosphaera aphanis]
MQSLVNYSDSENSESSEENHVDKQKPSSKSSKPTFQKVVDRSNTGKVKIPLPEAFIKDNKENEPPTKKVKAGEDTLSSFNSFLPAPKRSMSATSISPSHTPNKKRVFIQNIGPAPGIYGNPASTDESAAEEQVVSTTDVNSVSNSRPQQNAIPRVASARNSLLYKLLSVSRTSESKRSVTNSRSLPVTPKINPEKAPKVSLFSLSVETEKLTPSTNSRVDEYQPLIYDISEDADEESVGERVQPTYEDYTPTSSLSSFSVPPPAPTPPISNSLQSLAERLHLSSSEKRQLFGRNKGVDLDLVSNILSFNMDQEYSHNEELRAAGEQVVHNPVRSIAPGKHSLKQLVNAAQSQKEALEESFAKGKSNRAEASSRYGW